MTSFRTITRFPFLNDKIDYCPHIADSANIAANARYHRFLYGIRVKFILKTLSQIIEISKVCNDSDDCNTIRYPGWEDAGEDECPEDCIQPTPPVSTDEPITITDPVNPPTTTGTSATKAGFTVFAIITAVMTLF